MALSPFDAPIPGQSLTAEAGSVPWEKPSQMSDPLEVFEMYMEKLADDATLEDVMDMLDIGIPVSVVSETMLGMGVVNGMHTVDVKLLIQPMLSTQIKILADAVGVDYKLTMADYGDKDAKAKQKRAAKLAAKLAMKTDTIATPRDEGDKIMMEAQENLETPKQQELPLEEPKPKGLMSKEQM